MQKLHIERSKLFSNVKKPLKIKRRLVSRQNKRLQKYLKRVFKKKKKIVGKQLVKAARLRKRRLLRGRGKKFRSLNLNRLTSKELKKKAKFKGDVLTKKVLPIQCTKKPTWTLGKKKRLNDYFSRKKREQLVNVSQSTKKVTLKVKNFYKKKQGKNIRKIRKIRRKNEIS